MTVDECALKIKELRERLREIENCEDFQYIMQVYENEAITCGITGLGVTGLLLEVSRRINLGLSKNWIKSRDTDDFNRKSNGTYQIMQGFAGFKSRANAFSGLSASPRWCYRVAVELLKTGYLWEDKTTGLLHTTNKADRVLRSGLKAGIIQANEWFVKMIHAVMVSRCSDFKEKV